MSRTVSFSVDLAIEPLSKDSIDDFKTIGGSGKEIIEHIDSFATLVGKKIPEPLEECPPPPRETRRVIVVHHDGRARPTMYGVQFTPHETRLADFSKELASLVGLERDECFVWGWCSFNLHRTSFGGSMHETDLVPMEDTTRHYSLTAWRVPVSETYYMFDCVIGVDIGSVAPLIFLGAYDLDTLLCGLRPYIENEDIFQTLLVDAVCMPNPNPIDNTTWRRVVVVLGDHVRDHGTPPYNKTETYITHPSASPNTLHDEWRQQGGAIHRRELLDDVSARGVRAALRRCSNRHNFRMTLVDPATIRLTMDTTTMYSPFVPWMDTTNARRWCTALHIGKKFTDHANPMNALLTLLEMDEHAPCDEHPTAIKVQLKHHQLQNLYRLRHLEEKTDFTTTLFTQCAENAWWDPRTNGLHKKQPGEISGGFLCDTVGLGKTLSMIALCVSRPPEDANAYKTLVICPPSILVQWRREIEKYSSLSVLEYHGKKKQGVTRDTLRTFDIVLTTYTTYLQNHMFSHVRQDDGTYVRDPIPWHRVIYDESHTMSERFTRADFIIHARHRWCVTATPFNNATRQFRALGLPFRYSDYGFPAMYYILEPLLIRHTQRHSNELPELTMEDVAVQFQTEGEKRLYEQAHARVKHDFQSIRNIHLDALKVHSHINTLRRLCTAGTWSLESLFTSQPSESSVSLKPDFNLVAPHDEDDMCPICMNIYEQPRVTLCNHWFCADCIATALSMSSGKCPMCRHPLTVHDLRAGVLFGQVPDEDPMEDIVYPGTTECSSKLKHLMTMLETMRHRDATSKALVFCESSATIPAIMDALKDTGFKARCIHGSMAALQRGSAIRAFQEDARTTVFVSSLRSAAAGINLTAANHIFFLGPVTNQANYTQAIGRAHRTGQTRHVTVHRLFMEGTIEDELRAEQHWTLEKLCTLF